MSQEPAFQPLEPFVTVPMWGSVVNAVRAIGQDLLFFSTLVLAVAAIHLAVALTIPFSPVVMIPAWVFSAVTALFLQCPAFVLAHRRILLDEATHAWRWRHLAKPIRAYSWRLLVIIAAVISMVVPVGSLALLFLMDAFVAYNVSAGVDDRLALFWFWILATLTLALSVLAVRLVIRFWLAFPAAAVGGQDFVWNASWRASKGNGLRMAAAAFVVACLAALLWQGFSMAFEVILPVGDTAAGNVVDNPRPSVFEMAIRFAILAFVQVLMVVMLSQWYRDIRGNNPNGPSIDRIFQGSWP